MEEAENIALFDAYLRHELSVEERKLFEKRLSESAEFKLEFEQYCQISSEIKEGFEYAAIQKKLNEIHNHLYRPKKPILLRPSFLLPLGIAASIAFLFLLNYPSLNESADNSNYSPLANVQETAASEEKEMNGNLDNGYENTTVDTAEFGLNITLPFEQKIPKGTAFLLSRDGYFLTSKHLVGTKKIIKLQHKKLGLTFETRVVYTDSLVDLAVLQCSNELLDFFSAIPYSPATTPRDLGDEVFTLGYPKRDIVYTKGVISSATGYDSDSLYFEVSLPSNVGQSGAPLFSQTGEFIGIITANRSDRQAVTYVLKNEVIFSALQHDSTDFSSDLFTPKKIKFQTQSERIKTYCDFIFEVH